MSNMSKMSKAQIRRSKRVVSTEPLKKEYIKRGALTLDEAIAHCRKKAERDCDACCKEHAQLAEWLTELKHYKAADVVEVKHGRWHDVYSITPWMAMGVCSCCCNKSFINPDFPNANYCPNCGARMGGE